MKWKDPAFRYYTAEESTRIGYLSKRLKAYAKALEEQKKATEAKVSPIKRAK